jgi:signal transduction histidine kinase
MADNDSPRRTDEPAPPGAEATVAPVSDLAGPSFARELADFARDAHLVSDADGVILEADDMAAVLLRCPRQFLAGKPLGLFVAESHRRAFYERMAHFGAVEPPTVLETRLGRGRAEPRDVVLMRVAVTGPEGQLAGFRWVLRDISAARRVEQTLRAERQLLDSVVDAAETIILVVDDNARVLRSNAYTHTLAGRSPNELNGRVWWDALLPPSARPAANTLFQKARAVGRARSDVLPLLTPRGKPPSEITWSARTLPEGVLGAVVLFGYDVSELQAAQRQALQAERLAAIGEMAAGLAHESRNALQRIQACLTVLGLRLQDRPDALDLLGRAQKAQDDLHHLFEDVLGYAATPRLMRAPCDLAAVWREAWADAVAAKARQGAELVEDVGDADLTCDIDRFQLARVFLNLFENALAVAADPARVVIRARPARLGNGPAVEVSVRDNGPGFPAEARARLFEPFFTTKTRGTGLGLAICRRVVAAHGGRIEADEGGPGAEIRITLPRRSP